MPLIQIKSPIKVKTGQELRIPFSITDDEAVVMENISASLYPPYLLDLWEAIAAGDYTFTRASSATYVDQDGVIQTASMDVLRSSHYVQGERALLIEGQRTNLFLNSAFNDGWELQGTSTGNTVSILTGGPINKKCVIVTDGTGSRPGIWQNVSGVEQVSVSVLARRTSGAGSLQLRWGATSAAYEIALPEDNEWYECRINDVPAGGNYNTIIEVASTSIAGTFEVGHAQLEESAFTSSTIPTEDSTVTRAADAFALTGTWDEQPVTQYERFYDQATGAITDEIHQFTGTTAQALALFRAYTHVIVATGTRSIEYMRLLAGVTA